MKFTLLAATASAAPVVPTPAAYTMVADELVFASGLITTDNDIIDAFATQNAFSAAKQMTGTQKTGGFGCVATGNVEITNQTFTPNVNDGQAIYVRTAASSTNVNGWWANEDGDIGVSPIMSEAGTSAATLDVSAGALLIAGAANSGAITAGAAGDLYDCCKRYYDAATITDQEDFHCPLVNAPETALTLIEATDASMLVAGDIVYTTADVTDDLQIAGSNAGLTAGEGHTERNTDFYLSAMFQNMADAGTAANNWCIVGDASVTTIHHATTTSEITAQLMAQTGSAAGVADQNMKCTFQFYSADEFAPSIKVQTLGDVNYTVQYAEWMRNDNVSVTAGDLIGNALPSAQGAAFYNWDPTVADAFTQIAKTYAAVPGSWGPLVSIDVHAYGEMEAADATADYTILAEAAPLQIGQVSSNIFTIWNQGVAGVSESLKEAMDDYNTDASAWNDDIADVESAREEGKTAEEDGSDDLPDRPCEPATITYPQSLFQWDVDFNAPAADMDDDKRFLMTPFYDPAADGASEATTAASTMVVGNLALLNTAASSTYDYSQVWARKVFGRMGQAHDDEGDFTTGFRAYFDAAATDVDYEQWMQFSIFPNDVTTSVTEADVAAEIRVNQVAIEAFPSGFTVSSAGSADSLDELEGAAALAASGVALAAIAVSLF